MMKKKENRPEILLQSSFLAKSYNDQSESGHLGKPDDNVKTLVSYPVKWSDETKRFMVETAKKAGFPNVEGVDEANAAINCVLVQNKDYIKKNGYFIGNESVNILLVDMGAGTTDLVLCKYFIKQDKTEIMCTWPVSGDILFGGKEVDEILRDYIGKCLPEEVSESVLKRVGTDKFKIWKETEISPSLKSNDKVEFFSDLDQILEFLEIEDVDYSIDREIFEQAAKDYLCKFTQLICGCIERGNMSADDVDLVILTGGHSQWYFVNEILSSKMRQFGDAGLKKVIVDSNRIIPIVRPQETVALGLVYSQLNGGPDSEYSTKSATKQDFVRENGFDSDRESEFVEKSTPPTAKHVTPDEKEIIAYDVLELGNNNERAVMTIMPEKTVINVGDSVEFYRNNHKVVSSIVKEIVIGNNRVMKAEQGDEVVLIFENVTAEIRKYDIITVTKKASPAMRKGVVSLYASPVDGGSVDGMGEYPLYERIKIRAVPMSGYRFDRWSDGCTDATRTVSVLGDKTLTALFEKSGNTQAILNKAAQISKEIHVDLKNMQYTPENEFTVIKKGNICMISKYIGNRLDVSVPPTIAGKIVIGLGNYAFGGLTVFTGCKVRSVVLPETVTTIGKYAFSGCVDLQTVIAHRKITSIGGGAFYGCNNLKTLDFDMGECIPGKVVFPPGLTTIGYNALKRYKAPYGTRRSIFDEVFISRNTVVKDSLGDKTFHPKYTTVYYYD